MGLLFDISIIPNLLFTSMFLLFYRIGFNKMEDGIETGEERCLCQLRKSCLYNERNVRIFESSQSRLE